MNDQEFHERILKIDRHLIEENVPIPNRPLAAISRYAKEYKCIVFIATPPNHKKSPDKYDKFNLGDTINEWFKNKYGVKLVADLNMGCVGLLISGDVFKLKIPIFFCSMVGEKNGKSIKLDRIPGHQLLSFNIYKFVESITPNIIKDISQEEKLKAYSIFNHAVELYNLFERENLRSELINSAKADYEKSIDYLMGNNKSTGLSKWSSLQATEKVLKSALSCKKVNFHRTHNLFDLFEQLYSIGFPKSDDNLIGQVQCLPGIRYGDNKYSLAEAINSHHISIFLCNKIMRFCA
jgi:hypothetical protein